MLFYKQCALALCGAQAADNDTEAWRAAQPLLCGVVATTKWDGEYETRYELQNCISYYTGTTHQFLRCQEGYHFHFI